MSRLITWNLVTFDGFFGGTKPWELDWHEQAWDEAPEARPLSSGCVILRYEPVRTP